MSNSLSRVKQAADQRLWLPRHGRVDTKTSACIRVVENYDEALVLGRHELTGDWCVFLKQDPFSEPFPVLGLGLELPTPEQLSKRLVQADTKRQGSRVIDEIEREHADRRAVLEDRASDATGITAEAYEWGHRRMCSQPHTRIFVPAGT